MTKNPDPETDESNVQQNVAEFLRSTEGRALLREEIRKEIIADLQEEFAPLIQPGDSYPRNR